MSSSPESLPARDAHLLRHALIALWWWTVAASLFEWNGQSLALLHQGGLTHPVLAHGLIAAGVLLDAALALALMFRPGRLVYLACGLAVIAMTLTASVLLSGLWLHPLGPLSKNLPVLAMLTVLWRHPK